MKRSVVTPYIQAAAMGAGFLIATTIEAGAGPPKYGPVALPCGQNDWGLPIGRNTTGRTIPNGTKVQLTICDSRGCRTVTGHVFQPDFEGAAPGQAFIIGGFRDLLEEGTTCSVTVNFPAPFEERPKPPVKEYSRTRPPGPPQPGLLETNPGYSPQSPSGMGTPTKPSAPPPSYVR